MPIRASVAVRTWGKSLSITLGVAAAAAAAQLGIAYGFAILLWAKDFTERSGAAWASNLTWVCWLAATAVVIGAIVGSRVTEAAGLPQTLLTHAAVMVSSAAGALVTVPLVAVPARYAQLAGDVSPAYTAARIAVLGVVIGAVVSVGVLLGRPLAWNIVAVNSWLWLLALGSVLVGLRSGTVPETVRLGIWGDASGWLAVVVPLLLVAFGIGAGLAYLAKRQGANRVAVAVCGTPGPVLIAVAYLIAGPGSRPETGSHLVPYLAAPYTVLAGLLGSLLVAAIERPEPGPETAGNGGDLVTAASPLPAGPQPPTHDDPTTGDMAAPEQGASDPAPADVITSDTTTLDATADSPATGAATPEATSDFTASRPFSPGPYSSGPSSSRPQPYLATAALPVVDPELDGDPMPVAEPLSVREPQPVREPRSMWSEVVDPSAEESAAARFGVPEKVSELSETRQLPPVPAAAPTSKEAASGRHEWDDDEAWLEQIKGDDAVRRPRPSPGPRPRRRSWSLFTDESESFDTPGPVGGGDADSDQR